MPLNAGGPISLIGSITGQSIAKQLNISETAQLDFFNSSVRTLLQQASGPVSMFNAYGQPRANSDMYIFWPSSLSGGNFNTLGSSRVIQNGHYLIAGGTVTTTWTMKAFPTTARGTAINMVFSFIPSTREMDNSIHFGPTNYYYNFYNSDPYNDSRTYCGYGASPANTDAQVAGMVYYALNGGAGGSRIVDTNSPYGTSGITVAATLSGNDITCTMTNNTGSDQFIYPVAHNGGSTQQLWYWGWFYTGEYASSLFDYSFNRGTWNNQSATTYGLPLYSVVQVILNGITYNMFYPHQSGVTQATVISNIKSQLEIALGGLESAAITNVSNGLKIATIGIPTINYTYYFPTGVPFFNGTDPSYFGSTNFTPTITNVAPEFVFNQTIASNTNDYNLRNAAIAGGWNQVLALNATITINAGVFVGSSSTGSAAFQTGSSFPAGSTLTVINNGSIVGCGGNGGSANFVGSAGGGGGGVVNGSAGTRGTVIPPSNLGSNGTNTAGGAGGLFQTRVIPNTSGDSNHNGTSGSTGGLALSIGYATTVTNNGTIGGGGGGGGGGSGTLQTIFPGGQMAILIAAGAGGTGGNLGSAGSAGQTLSGSANGGAGGAAGAAISGNSNITYLATGTILGAIS